MNITRDVVKDLLALYLAGDASPDTRAVVEDWLRTDADLARQVAEARRADLPPVPRPDPSAEKLALMRTRSRLRWRAITLGAAIYFTTLPLTVVFSRQGFRGLLIQDWWERVVLLAVAAGLWATWFALKRRVSRTGL